MPSCKEAKTTIHTQHCEIRTQCRCMFAVRFSSTTTVPWFTHFFCMRVRIEKKINVFLRGFLSFSLSLSLVFANTQTMMSLISSFFFFLDNNTNRPISPKNTNRPIFYAAVAHFRTMHFLHFFLKKKRDGRRRRGRRWFFF